MFGDKDIIELKEMTEGKTSGMHYYLHLMKLKAWRILKETFVYFTTQELKDYKVRMRMVCH